jgi:hypothetical protein
MKQIPGFYWDEVRKRYFRIEQNGHVPHGHTHSQQNVAKTKRQRKTEKESKRKLAIINEAHRKVNTGARIPKPIKRINWDKSLSGYRLKLLSQVPSYRGPRTGLKNYLSTFTSGKEGVNRGVPRRLLNAPLRETVIGSFAWDSKSNLLHFSSRSLDGTGIYHGSHELHAALFGENGLDHISEPVDTSISGIAMEPEYEILSRKYGNYHLQWLHNPRLSVSSNGDVGILGNTEDQLCAYHNVKFRFEADGTSNSVPRTTIEYWKIAQNSWNRSIAYCGNPFYGTENRFLLAENTVVREYHMKRYTFSENNFNGLVRKQNFRPTGADVRALEYLSAHIFAAGLRNGGVAIWDTRTDSFDGAMIINHNSWVSHISRVDDDCRQLIVAGVNRMSLYDIRMPSQVTTPESFFEYRTRVPPTQPVFDYLEYSNRAHTDLGFHMSHKYGVFAAATDKSCSFNLYTPQSPIPLKTFELPPEDDHVDSGAGAVIRQLQIIDGTVMRPRILALGRCLWNFGPDRTLDDHEVELAAI